MKGFEKRFAIHQIKTALARADGMLAHGAAPFFMNYFAIC
jgi:hypothetical protein